MAGFLLGKITGLPSFLVVNTMVMSILERYSEIGIMKAVGARDSDIQKIFFLNPVPLDF